MEQTILTKEQLKALEEIRKSEIIAKTFYLTGGTALSEFYLKHRFSDDLDFFTDAEEFPQVEVEALIEKIRLALGADAANYRRLYDRRIFFLPYGNVELKIEFTYYPFLPINPREKHDSILVDSFEDIVVGKWMALMDRIEAKDFVDFYFIIREARVSLKSIRDLVNKKFHILLEAATIGSELAKVRNLDKLPKMAKPLTLDELKAFFADQSKSLENELFQ